MRPSLLRLLCLSIVVSVLTGSGAAGVTHGATGDPVLLNEVLASHTGTDNTEYAELYGTPGTSLAGRSLIVVEGDAGTSAGTIDRRIDFGAGDALGANGFYLVGNPSGLGTNYAVVPDRSIANDFFENSSLTVALVDTASLAGGVGTTVTGSEVVRDAVGLTDGGAGDSFYFSAPRVGPDGSFFPAGARRVTDGLDTDAAADWVIADFALGPANTPTPAGAPPCTTEATIAAIQGAGHLSPLDGTCVRTGGVVTVKRGNGFYLQSTAPDASDATSEAIFVATGPAQAVSVGDEVAVEGTVDESRAAGTALTTTVLVSQAVLPLSSGNALPAPVVLGSAGRVPPSEVIEDDSSGSVESAGTLFDPAEDGMDFFESVEGMRVQVDDAVAVGPTNPFGEIAVVGDAGENAGVDTVRGGIVIGPDDFNPERIILDDALVAMPLVNVGDGFEAPIVGVVDYSFGNYKLLASEEPDRVDNGLEREVTREPSDHEVVVGTYNVENLDPGDGAEAFARHAELIVDHLRSPDVLAIEEVQDNNGPTDDSVTDAALTWNTLIAAIQAAGGPTYEYRQIDPVDDEDGGEPGGNIRVGFLFRTDRGVEFIDRAGGGPTTTTTVVDHASGPRLSSSPGRVAADAPAFADTRKSLAGEFRMRGKKVFVIANHFSSKGSDQPLFGRFQPPTRFSEIARHGQAQAVNDFVDELRTADPNANVIVLGDINDFDFSETVEILEGGVLTTLMDTVPKAERYSYVFDGNSQVLDQILVSDTMLARFPVEYDPVHVNAEFADQASDHDPQVARLDLRGRPTAK